MGIIQKRCVALVLNFIKDGFQKDAYRIFGGCLMR